MNRPLTKQQQTVYDFIREKIVSRGYGPTVREIGAYMNIKSPNGVMCHLKALERKGMIRRTANRSRAIELTEPISKLVANELSAMGAIRGATLISLNTETSVPDPYEIFGDNRTVVQVLDDSLRDASIQSGDWLIVDREKAATSGQMVLVRFSETEISLRTLYHESGRYRLQPMERHQRPLLVESIPIVGVVVGIFRNLD